MWIRPFLVNKELLHSPKQRDDGENERGQAQTPARSLLENGLPMVEARGAINQAHKDD